MHVYEYANNEKIRIHEYTNTCMHTHEYTHTHTHVCEITRTYRVSCSQSFIIQCVQPQHACTCMHANVRTRIQAYMYTCMIQYIEP